MLSFSFSFSSFSFSSFSSSSSSSPLPPRLRRHLCRPLRQMSPDVNMDLQIAVGSAGPQQRAPDCSRQRRTSPGELWSGLGNARPQPGSSGADWATPDRGALERTAGADWATPDLTRGPPERSGQRRTSAARRNVRRCGRNMSEKNVRKNVRRYVRRNVRKYVKRYVRRYVKRYVRKECQKKCQKKCQKICQKKCQKICQKI